MKEDQGARQATGKENPAVSSLGRRESRSQDCGCWSLGLGAHHLGRVRKETLYRQLGFVFLRYEARPADREGVYYAPRSPERKRTGGMAQDRATGMQWVGEEAEGGRGYGQEPFLWFQGQERAG